MNIGSSTLTSNVSFVTPGNDFLEIITEKGGW